MSTGSKEYLSYEEDVKEERLRVENKVSEVAPTTARKAERRLKLKMDLRIIPAGCIMYLLCFLDRANIGNARVLNHDSGDALTDSLHL
ncbi:hypothetical protein M422DRAFT_783261, partial [Sphaerobolus stellatus SS14]